MEQNDSPADAPLSIGLPTTAAAMEAPRNILRTEARVRALGLLFMGLAPVFAFLFLVLPATDLPRRSHATFIALALILGFLAMLSIYAGIGLRRLQPPARIVAAVVACVASLHFPSGAVATALTLLVLHSPTTKTVFSKHHRQLLLVDGRPKPDLSWLDTLGLVILFPLLRSGSWLA
jgi:hypothetical protein